ncbi:MAG: TonB-dependent receptor, partial [Candidatus Marithrix sp.]|nr:TonB-dependent receptor [Candidatus Marithrix sp.]
MKLLKAILWSLFLSTQSPYAETFDIASLDAEKEARLQALMAMDMMELQEVEIKLDDVFDIFGALVKKQKISVASGRKENVATAPAVTSLITAQDIEAMGARTLEEALRSVPGLHVTVNGVAYRPMFSMRGMLTISNAEVLIMRNGIPINFPQTRNIGTGWGDMSVNNIARIEVIRGPGSALYGADAFAGVINIITKTAKDIDSTEIGLRYGTFNTKEAWILYGKQGEEAAGFLAELDFSIALELLDTDGLDAMIETDAQTIYDKRFGTQASNAPGPLNLQKQSYNVSVDTSWKDWTLRGNYQQRDKLGTGAGFGTALAPDDVINNKRYLLSLDYQRQLTANWLVKGGLSYQQWNSSNNGIHMFPAGAFGGLYPSGMILKTNTKNKASRGEISILYSGFNQHQVNLGTGINYEDLSKFDYWANFGLNASGNAIPPGSPIINLTGTANAMLRPVSRRNTYLFIQDSWNFMDDWLLTAGLRYDYYSDIGGTANPR